MRREPEPFRRCGRALVFRGRRPSHERMCHEQDSDHQRAALHQRRQAPRQSRRLASARGCARAFPPPTRRRGIVHLRHRRARHSGGARRDRGRRGRAPLLRYAACDPGGRLSPLRLVVRSLRPLVLPAEPCIDPASLRTAGCRRLDRRTLREPGVVVGGPALPARPLRARHLSALRLCGCARRPVRRLRDAAGSRRPRAAAFCALGRCARRVAREPSSLSAPIAAGGSPQCLARHPRGVAAFRGGAGEELAHVGFARSLHHPRSQLGRAGAGLREQGVLCLVRRADRLYRRDAGVGGTRPCASLAGLVVAGGRRPLHPVPGQGQRAVSRRELSRDAASDPASPGRPST